MTASVLARGALVAWAALAVASCAKDEKIIDMPYAGDAFPAPPPLALPAGGWAVTSNNTADTLTFFDLATRQVIDEYPVGLNPVDLDGPHHLAFNRQSRELFVALAYPAPAIIPGPHAAHGSAQVPGKVVRISTPDMRVLGVGRLDTNPGDIVLSDDGSRLVITHFDLAKAQNPTLPVASQRARMLVFKPTELVGTRSPSPQAVDVCIAPHGVALTKGDGRTAYVACYGEDALGIVDLANPALPVTLVPVGENPGRAPTLSYGPYAIAIDDTGARVAVGTTESREIRVFDASGKLLADKTWRADTAKGGVYFPMFDGDLLYVPVQSPDALVVLDLSGAAKEARRRTFTKDECQAPHEVKRSTIAGELLVVCEGDHVGPGKVLVVDAATLDIRATILTGAYPDRVEAVP